MSRRVRFPLVAKMLLGLLAHLVVLALAFYFFVAWQLRLGLDSFLSGTAGDRLEEVGERLASEIRGAPRQDWPEIVERHGERLGLGLSLQTGGGSWIGGAPERLPANVARRIGEFQRPELPPPRGSPGARGGGPPFPDGRAARRDFAPQSEPPPARPLFLLRGAQGGGYWAGVALPLAEPGHGPPLRGLLLLHSDDLSGRGLFFDVRPWLLGGLAVLVISLVLWAPFFIGITRYVGRLSRATEAIADGNFGVVVGAARADELGALGRSIESMAARLERLVRGQKRFLGDVAHELCSPLARLRTGLAVLEHGMSAEQRGRLESIEEDAEELARLVSEVLAFTKASTAPAALRLEAVALAPLVEAMLERECPGQECTLELPAGLTVRADRGLLARAIANVLRNARRHGGDECALRITATILADCVELRMADNGPGVEPAELVRLFEPFYRPDAARTREAGGAGLGLAIVRAGLEAFGGNVSAESCDPHGLALVLRLPLG